MNRTVLIAVSLTTAVVLVLLVAAFIAARALRDLPEPPDDSDLFLAERELPPPENALFFLCAAADTATFSREETEYIKRFRRHLESDDTWEHDTAASILEQNQQALEYLARGLACTDSYAFMTTTDGSEVYLNYYEEPAIDLAWIQIRDLNARGHHAEAFHRALALMKLGLLVRDSRGGIDIYRTGEDVAQASERLAALCLPHVSLSEEAARRCIEVIEESQQDAEILVNAFKSDYVQLVRSLPDADEGGPEGRAPGFLDPSTYKPNETRTLLAQVYREAISCVALPYHELPQRVLAPPIMTVSTPREWLRRLPNTRGREFLEELSLYSPGNCLANACFWRSQRSALQVLIALKCEWDQNGVLPESLEELVPEYFDSVPLDHFDGKPIKYSLEKGLVYCVGADLKDMGGTVGEIKNWELTPDPGWAIEF